MNSNDKVYNTLKNAKDRWVTSRDAQDLRAQLAQVVKEGKLVGVKKIVCFGLGPPALWDHCDPPNGDGSQEEVTSRSLVQHIAALVMAETINQASGSGSGNITVYSQEPLYRPEEDMPALEAHGIQVLDGHKGFVSVDQDTLVFAPAPTLKVYQVICETARPAGIIFILAVVPANTRKRLHAIFDVLDLEYDMYLDWPPFYHPVYHGNYKPMPWGAPRPLSGCIVWLRKAEVWSEDALVSSGR
jgi:hypothetical protein